MKRRKFLGMLGAATASPMLPLPAIAAAPAATYTPAALHGAILHAQASGHVSVQGLTHLLRIPPAGAEALMQDMMNKGILAPMQGTNPVLGWAKSRIYKPRFAMRVPTRRTQIEEPDLGQQREGQRDSPAQDPLFAHLHYLCRAVGMALHPSCARQAF